MALFGTKNQGEGSMKGLMFSILFLLASFSAFATSTRILDAQQITNGSATLTLPSSTDTLLGRTTTDTVTNKSFSGASNTFTLIPVGAIGNGSVLSGSNTGDATIGTGNGLSFSGQALSLQLSSGSQPGALSAADWTTFNSKLSASLADGFVFVGNGAGVATGVALSGDVTIINTGAVTIGAKKVQASKLDSGAAASGTVATADGSGGVSYSAIPSSSPATSGTRASPTAIVAGTGVVFSGSNYSNVYFIAGSGGPVTVSANPQISAGSSVGQFLTLVGRSATNTVTLADATGLSLNGAWVGGLDSVLRLMWDGTNWLEIARR